MRSKPYKPDKETFKDSPRDVNNNNILLFSLIFFNVKNTNTSIVKVIIYEEIEVPSIFVFSSEYHDNLSDKAIINCTEGNESINLTIKGIPNMSIKTFFLDRLVGIK